MNTDTLNKDEMNKIWPKPPLFILACISIRTILMRRNQPKTERKYDKIPAVTSEANQSSILLPVKFHNKVFSVHKLDYIQKGH